MLVALPSSCLRTIATASSKSFAFIMHSTGPKISSWPITISGVTSSKIVGPR